MSKAQATQKDVEEMAEEHTVCNDFCEAYKKENPEAIIKYGVIKEGDIHCYIYDPETDQTIDPTLEQFSNYNPDKYQNNYWNGENHPHITEIASFNNIENFEEEFFSKIALEKAEEIQKEV